MPTLLYSCAKVRITTWLYKNSVDFIKKENRKMKKTDEKNSPIF
jgi:hypothetical protein